MTFSFIWLLLLLVITTYFTITCSLLSVRLRWLLKNFKRTVEKKKSQKGRKSIISCLKLFKRIFPFSWCAQKQVLSNPTVFLFVFVAVPAIVICPRDKPAVALQVRPDLDDDTCFSCWSNCRLFNGLTTVKFTDSRFKSTATSTKYCLNGRVWRGPAASKSGGKV